MRRIAIALSLVAVVVGLHSCAADAPTRPPSGGGGTPSTALQIQLFTSDANPRAGSCTLIEAVVSLNGSAVPDGTSVSFTTDFGSFSQNGLPVVSVVTTNGAAVTALCGPGAGSAKIKATVTIQGKTGSATLTISFQPDSGTLPFVSSCSPSLGGKQGGETLTLNGGRFFGSASTSRVQFTANGITRDGVVTSVTPTSVVVQTAAFPELTAPNTPAAVILTLGTNLPAPVVLSLPTCFSYGTVDSGTPSISALLPSSGTNEGNTRVTIIGSGFSTKGVQVFFTNPKASVPAPVEATVISVNFNQVVVLSPPASGAGHANLNALVDVTVKNIDSGLSSLPASYQYTPAMQITAANNTTQSINQPFTAVTIFGQGFQAPVAVTLAGVPAIVQSVSATELVVLPSFPLLTGCGNISSLIHVVNINSGDFADGPNFTYVVPQLVITGISPLNDGAGANTSVTISGTGLPALPSGADVKFGSKTAFVTGSSPGTLTVSVPPGSVVLNPSCINGNLPPTPQVVETVDITVTNRATTCTATVAQAFSYLLPCAVPTNTPGP